MWVTEKTHRLAILGYIVVAIVLLLLLRLAWMQLLQGPQYKRFAEENRVRRITVAAPRGVLYDRHGRVLADSRPSFALSVIPGEYENAKEATVILARITGFSPSEIEAMIRAGEEFPYTPVRIKQDLDAAMIAQIEERKFYLPGVLVEAVPVRHYPYQELGAHVLGFIGRISEEEYALRKGKGYHPQDLIGKDGLEREWEALLRGQDGGREVEINALGEDVGLLGQELAVPGRALGLTLDAALQQAAGEALTAQIAASRKMGEPAKGGAIVALDVKTGGVLAMISQPSYNPNAFAGGISAKDWNTLISSPDHPLTNRVIQSAYPPGSVFKIVTAAAALESGLATPEEIIEDKGYYMLSGWKFYGWNVKGLGRLTVVDALAKSSDPYFYEMGRRLGADNLASYALTFGFGQKSGIRLAGEVAGLVPTEEWKLNTYGEEWLPGETLIAAIGQGYYNATPLQQALLLMAVANGGVIYRPMLVDRVFQTDEKREADKQEPEVLQTVYLQPEVWESLRQGLEAVVDGGTAAASFQNMDVRVAGKTGSAETGRGTTHAWFACYAPAEAPEIALAVFVEDGGDGSVAAAPIARQVLDVYFNEKKTNGKKDT